MQTPKSKSMFPFRFIKIKYLSPLSIAYYRTSLPLWIQLTTTNTKSDFAEGLLKDSHMFNPKWVLLIIQLESANAF